MKSTPIRFDIGTFDPGAAQWIRTDGKVCKLSPIERAFLSYLIEHGGQTLSRDQLLQQVWGYAEGVRKTRAVDNAVRRLRTKLDTEQAEDSAIRSIYGGGYRFEATPLDVVQVRADLPVVPACGLVGRDMDIRRLANSLADHSMVTLWGPGGVGKTSLARAVVAGGKSRWVDLSNAHSADDVAVTVALALDIPLADRAEATVERIGRVLSALDGVLVLDNCEQLDASCVPLFQLWGQGLQGLSILFTSRRALGMAGEQLQQLGTLDPESAYQVLKTRALEHAPAFDFDEDGSGWRGIVELLDGLPLAIVLIASRVGMVSAEACQKHLERSLGLARSRGGRDSGRHSTLTRCLEWSWELLSAEHQRALVALGQIPGPFDLDQAEAVIGGTNALESVDSLVQASLLNQAATGELGLLFAVQSFVHARASRADRAVPEARRRAWLLERATDAEPRWIEAQLVPIERAIWRGADEDPEVCARLARSLGHAAASIPTARLRSLYAMLLECLPNAHPLALHLRLDDVAIRRIRGGARPDLADETQEILELAEQTGEVNAQVRSQRTLSSLARTSGRLDEARERLETVRTLASEAGLHKESAHVHNELGLLASMLGELDEARRCHERALPLYRKANSWGGQVRTFANLGKVLRKQARYREAEHILTKALGMLDDRPSIDRGAVLSNLGNVQLTGGDPHDAWQSHHAACQVFRELGTRRKLAISTACLALVELKLGRTSEGTARALEVSAIVDEEDDPRALGDALEIAAMGSLIQRDLDEACALLDRVDQLYTRAGVLPGLADALRLRAVANALMGLPEPSGVEPSHPLIQLSRVLRGGDAARDLRDPALRSALSADLVASLFLPQVDGSALRLVEAQSVS